MAEDLKAATPDASFPSGAVLFGADSQAAASPSVYSESVVWSYWKTLASTFTNALTNSYTSLVSSPALQFTGAWFTGGTATTTKPHFLVEASGATSTGWSTSGTGLGVNSPSSFSGNQIDIQRNGASQFKVANGVCSALNSYIVTGAGGRFQLSGSGSSILSSPAAATWQLGDPDAASPAAQILRSQGSRAGTDSNVGGANFTVRSGLGTGTGTVSTLVFQTPVAVASGTGAQTYTTGLTVKSGAMVSPVVTVANLPTGEQGMCAFVSDATMTMTLGVGTVVAGTGANPVPVFHDGTNWRIG